MGNPSLIPDPDPGQIRSTPALGIALIVAIFYLAAAGPLIAVDYSRGRAAADQEKYYLPAVHELSRQWPSFDFSNYSSATTPGYLLLMAAVHRYISEDPRALRLASAIITAAFLGTLVFALTRRIGSRASLLLSLPAAASLYVFSSGAWVAPDNIGWWGVLALTLLALRGPVDWLFYIGGAVLLAALVYVRQVHIWTAALLWLSAWFGASDALPFGDWNRRAGRTALTLLLTLPAFLILLYFYQLWGALTPKQHLKFTQGPNFAVPATVLAVFGIAATFYLPWITGALRERMKVESVWGWIGFAAAVGSLAATIPETTFEFPRRATGVWHVVNRLPTLAGRSPAMMALAAWGAIMLAAFTLALRGRARWLFLTAWLAFMAAQTANGAAWQRYYEPLALMMLALGVSLVRAEERAAAPRWAPLGPSLLALLLATITVLSLR